VQKCQSAKVQRALRPWHDREVTRTLHFGTLARLHLGTLALLHLGTLTACAPQHTFTLGVQGRSNTSASVAAAGRTVAVVWTATSDSGSDIYFAASRDGGRSFGAPVRVNDVAGDSRASGEQPARVAIGGDVHVVWPSRDGAASVIRYARSTDGGRTFHPAALLSHAAQGARGWSSVALGPEGVLHTVWLDGRNASPSTHTAPDVQAHSRHQPGGPADGGAMGHGSPRQDVFHASWRPGAEDAESALATDVCFCCKTSVVATGSTVYAAWRHIFPGSIRDIAVARSNDAGQTFGEPVRVSEDGWRLDACPDDGPALAASPGGELHVVWPTLASIEPMRKGIFYSSSADGRAFAARARVDSGTADPAHPQIAADGNQVAIVWDETAKGDHRIMLRRAAAAGLIAEPETLTGGADGSMYPVVAAVPDGWLVLWTSQPSNGKAVIEGTIRPR
jgi:hypothetical protein